MADGRAPLPSLSRGVLPLSLFAVEDLTDDSVVVLQVSAIRSLRGIQGGHDRLYSLTLYDGVYTESVLLPSNSNHLVDSWNLQRGSIIQLSSFFWSADRRSIFVEDIIILVERAVITIDPAREDYKSYSYTPFSYSVPQKSTPPHLNQPKPAVCNLQPDAVSLACKFASDLSLKTPPMKTSTTFEGQSGSGAWVPQFIQDHWLDAAGFNTKEKLSSASMKHVAASPDQAPDQATKAVQPLGSANEKKKKAAKAVKNSQPASAAAQPSATTSVVAKGAIGLTPGAFPVKEKGELKNQPIVQVVDCFVGKRYELVISDGTYLQRAILTPQVSNLVKLGLIQNGTIVQLVESFALQIGNIMTIVVTNMDIIAENHELTVDPTPNTEHTCAKLRDPVPTQSSAASDTGPSSMNQHLSDTFYGDWYASYPLYDGWYPSYADWYSTNQWYHPYYYMQLHWLSTTWPRPQQAPTSKIYTGSDAVSQQGNQMDELLSKISHLESVISEQKIDLDDKFLRLQKECDDRLTLGRERHQRGVL